MTDDGKVIAAAVERTDEGASPKEAVRQEVAKVLHRHPRELMEKHTLTTGERMAGVVARTSGSWRTILPYLGVTIVYLLINHFVYAFDQTLQYYTFAVSVLAIFLAQVILLFQNRQSDIESALAHNAYEQTSEIYTMQQAQTEMLSKMDDLMGDVHQIIKTMGETPLTPAPAKRRTKAPELHAE